VFWELKMITIFMFKSKKYHNVSKYATTCWTLHTFVLTDTLEFWGKSQDLHQDTSDFDYSNNQVKSIDGRKSFYRTIVFLMVNIKCVWHWKTSLSLNGKEQTNKAILHHYNLLGPLTSKHKETEGNLLLF